jgi:hypothetical protein
MLLPSIDLEWLYRGLFAAAMQSLYAVAAGRQVLV